MYKQRLDRLTLFISKMQEAYEAGMQTDILSLAMVHMLLGAMCGISEADRVLSDLLIQTFFDPLDV